jgi:hypothetical protein
MSAVMAEAPSRIRDQKKRERHHGECVEQSAKHPRDCIARLLAWCCIWDGSELGDASWAKVHRPAETRPSPLLIEIPDVELVCDVVHRRE